MSKIYEALENAQQASRMLEKAEIRLPKTADATLLPSVVEMDFEKEMVTLFQNIESSLPDLERKVILFLSAKEGEGTSTIVREFARVAAKKLGKVVFLLDSSRSNPQKCLFLHISPECGWEEVTREGMGSAKDVQRGEMDLETCPASLLSDADPLNFYTSRMLDFWQTLRQRYDLVLIDSAAASSSPDGIEISRRVDGVVLVVEAEKTRWQVVENLKQKIEDSGGTILGVVFNKRRYYIPDAIYRRL
jgi:Mrp family chromosome partitioning ATPase